MNPLVDYGALLAGLGFFLLGMQQIESSLKGLAGRSMKLFIRRNTTSPLKGIAVGALTTGLLQSSSLVTLMLLAFVGAGILTLGNAIGVVFGASLGTTITGWLVTAAGFKLQIDVAAYPLIGLGALGTLFFSSDKKPAAFGRLLLGIGFLLLGLGLMKNGVESFAGSVDISLLRSFGPFVFLLVGVLLTGIIQSSSAAILIALSALSAGLVTLDQAAAFAIGAHVGTTFTVLLGSIRGKAASRQVALAHFFFNTSTGLVAFVLMQPLLYALRNVAGLEDPLFLLVAFHTSFNLVGILVFTPFIPRFARYLEVRFQKSDAGASRFINQITPGVPEAALEALRLETSHLLYRVLDLNRTTVGIRSGWQPALPYRPIVQSRFFERETTATENYELIKALEGEILAFSQSLQEHTLAPDEAARLVQLQIAVRHAVHSAKALKDVRHNLEDFAASLNDPLHVRFLAMQDRMRTFYERIEQLWHLDRSASRLAELASLAEENTRLHEEQNRDIYSNARKERLDDREVSTLLNVSRELFSSNKALISALKDFLLPAATAEEITELPGIA